MGYLDWEEALSDKRRGDPAECPECGKGRVDWWPVADPRTRVGFAVLWCVECLSGVHISRTVFPEGIAFTPAGEAVVKDAGLPAIRFVDPPPSRRSSRPPAPPEE